MCGTPFYFEWPSHYLAVSCCDPMANQNSDIKLAARWVNSSILWIETAVQAQQAIIICKYSALIKGLHGNWAGKKPNAKAQIANKEAKNTAIIWYAKMRTPSSQKLVAIILHTGWFFFLDSAQRTLSCNKEYHNVRKWNERGTASKQAEHNQVGIGTHTKNVSCSRNIICAK